MNQQEFILWSDSKIDVENWTGYVRHECQHIKEADITDMICELNHDLLDHIREQLDIQLGSPILMVRSDALNIASPLAFSVIPSGNIRDCFSGNTQNTTWYVDANGDFHKQWDSGTKREDWLYRIYRDGSSEDQIEELKVKLLDGSCGRMDLCRVTRRLGPIIAKVFTLPFPEAPSRTLVM